MDLVLLLLGVLGACIVAVIFLVMIMTAMEGLKDWVGGMISKRREKKERIEALEERVRDLEGVVHRLNERLYERTVVHNGGAQYYHVQAFREPDVYVKDLTQKIMAHLGLKITFLPGRGPDYFLEPDIDKDVEGWKEMIVKKEKGGKK